MTRTEGGGLRWGNQFGLSNRLNSRDVECRVYLERRRQSQVHFCSIHHLIDLEWVRVSWTQPGAEGLWKKSRPSAQSDSIELGSYDDWPASETAGKNTGE